jgi:predicted DsbA family dithiol-disulfide isomerase
MTDDELIIELFADVLCPFTHVGLRRFVARRAHEARAVRLWVRAWPLEVVNGEPLAPDFVAQEVDALRASVAPDLFAGFEAATFPRTSLPALALSAAAARRDPATGEHVALELRGLVFEQGVDVADPAVLADVAGRFDVTVEPGDRETVLADVREGETRGVVGSPHFFTPDGSFFCPSLDIGHDEDGTLRVRFDEAGFDEFVAACFG